MEPLNCLRPDQRFLSNTTLKRLHEVLWSGYPIPWCYGLRTLRRGHAGIGNCVRRANVRVLGNLLEEGVVTKLADDLYCGGNTPTELLHNWKRVLQELHSPIYYFASQRRKRSSTPSQPRLRLDLEFRNTQGQPAPNRNARVMSTT